MFSRPLAGYQLYHKPETSLKHSLKMARMCSGAESFELIFKSPQFNLRQRSSWGCLSSCFSAAGQLRARERQREMTKSRAKLIIDIFFASIKSDAFITARGKFAVSRRHTRKKWANNFYRSFSYLFAPSHDEVGEMWKRTQKTTKGFPSSREI